jgi:hypothetical protein
VGGSGPDERRGGGEGTSGSARAPGAPLADPVANLVAEAAAELYGAAPEAFTERRKALAAAATAAGDKRAAAAIASLRKPTRAAWVVNQLARAEPDAPARLAALAGALRAAERDKDGPRLRELSAERGTLIDALTAQALAAGCVPDPPTSLRDEVAATLTAALADPATATEFTAGTLTKAAHWSGFGFGAAGLTSPDGDVAPADEADSSAAGSGDEPARGRAPSRASRGAAAKRDGPSQAGRSSPSAPAPSSSPAHPPDEVAARRASQQRRVAEERRKEEEERRADEQRQRLAREAAERAAERRKNYEDAERTVVSAATATADAGAAEERLEAEVRDLEERLIQARADLAKARLRARHAEAAERRARQALERLPRP